MSLRLYLTSAIWAAIAWSQVADAQPTGDFERAVELLDTGNLRLAFPQFLALAERGDARAQFNLAMLYNTGRGVEQNPLEAAKWFRRAAEQGEPTSQFNLGYMYKNGRGVPRDAREAAEWYLRAALQGVPDAQFNLAQMYARGDGVLKDEAKAVALYKPAAEQGYVMAQRQFGLHLAIGQGVERDEVEAFKWLSLAAASGDETASKGLQSVTERLTASQLADAADRLARWKRNREPD
jgi:TPR repeat protein